MKPLQVAIRQRISILSLLLLILIMAWPTPASATFPWMYTWGTPIGPSTGCGTEAGHTGYACIDANSTCYNIGIHFYHSPYAFVTWDPNAAGGQTPYCNYYYIYPSKQQIGPFCPTGYTAWTNSLRGCRPNGLYLKDLGAGCSIDGSPCPMAGDPFNVTNGQLYEREDDYTGSGKHPLSFSRSYNALAFFKGRLGFGWMHNFERTLNLYFSTGMRATRPDGKVLFFNKSGANWVALDSDNVLKLAASGTNFTLTDENDSVETYDSTYKLLSIVARDGYTQTMTYTSGVLTSVSDSLGRTLAFTYDTNGNLHTMTDPDGNVFTYGYADPWTSAAASDKILSTVTYPAASGTPTKTYHYGDSNYPLQMTGITDELGHSFAAWAYNDDGQIVSAQRAGGAGLVTATYNADGTRTITSPLGGQVKYTFTFSKSMNKITREDRLASGTIPAANRVFTYDTNGFLSSETDWNGNKTTYVHNSRGLETSRTEAYTTGLARTITTAWSSTFRVPTQIVQTGLTTDFTYDANGNMLTRTQTDTQTQSVPYSTNGATRAWTYTYDSLGNVLTADGPRTDVTDTTTYTYDATTKNLLTATDALSHQTQITSYNNRGLPLTVIDPNSVETDLTYDPRGHIASATVIGGAGNEVTGFTYNAAGLLTLITLPDSSTLAYEYDDAQRLTAVQNTAGERIEYTLDADGNITTQNVKNSGGTIVKTQSRVFDVFSRLITAVGANSLQTTAYGYDSYGNRTSITNANSKTVAQAFDALNRLITVTDPLTHAASTGYDARDSVTSQTDFLTLSTTYVRDGFNRVIQKTSPDTGTVVYTLDKAGNVTSETDARGVVTNRTFDALNRVTAVTFPAYSSENIAYSYDDTTSGNKGINRLTGITDESGSTSLKYDDFGNVTQEVRVIGSQTYTTSYSYDLANRITQIIYPSGRYVNYTYDSSGYLTTVTTKPTSGGSVTTLASSIVHKPFGPVASFTYGNSESQTRTYDGNYWLTDLDTVYTGTYVQQLDYGYDYAGNLTSITDNQDATRNETFTVDDLNRLSTASGKYGSRTYTYDDNSGRATKVAGATTYTTTRVSSKNRVDHINDGTNQRDFTWTASGNMATDDRDGIGGGALSNTYGGRDRLESMTVGGNAVTFKINAFGQRVYKAFSGATTHYVHDIRGLIIAEANGSTGSTTKEYAWMEGELLAQIDSSGNIVYVHNSHLGAPQKITDPSRAVVWDQISEPFGEVYSTPTNTTPTTHRFPGQIFDAENGLHYNNHRDYDPTMGMYVQADPIGQAGGLNQFAYADGNPTQAVDPSGLQEILLTPEIKLPTPGEIAETPVGKTPLDQLPQGSAGGPGAGKDFPKSMQPDPENMPKCAYCGQQTVKSDKPCPERYNNDHGIPKSQGGNNTEANRIPSCQNCNLSKGSKTNEQWYNALRSKLRDMLIPPSSGGSACPAGMDCT